MCKNQGENLYPDVSLHDCSLTKIEVSGTDVKVKFSKYGFMKKHDDGHYYGTSGANIIIKNISKDNLMIKEIRNQKISENIFIETMYDIDGKTVINNVNSGKWRFEIFQELYAENKALYVAEVGEGGSKSVKCAIKILFDSLIYEWDDILHDYKS